MIDTNIKNCCIDVGECNTDANCTQRCVVGFSSLPAIDLIILFMGKIKRFHFKSLHHKVAIPFKSTPRRKILRRYFDGIMYFQGFGFMTIG